MTAVVVGGGPAGLMAAETLAMAGVAVTVVDHMPSVGRKLLMAGRGGLNLTHAEPLARLLDRYGAARERLAAAIGAFPPEAVRAWSGTLGQPTFEGTSGRIFPVAMKASPLLRAWLARLGAAGVRLLTRRRWTGWTEDGSPMLDDGTALPARAVVLACGGASWPRLGSDGHWTNALPGLRVKPLRPANCGFGVAWSAPFAARHAGAPLKRIAASFGAMTVRGEAMITADGIEGGVIYALSGPLRDAIAASGRPVALTLDLRPDLTTAELNARVGRPRRGQSLSTFLRKAAALSPVAVGLVQEALHAGAPEDDLAGLIKSMSVRLTAPRPIARAISTAGGLEWDELDDRFMLIRRPGVFAAGEMLDWEAPTGGYLLQAAFSMGVAAGRGALAWIEGP